MSLTKKISLYRVWLQRSQNKSLPSDFGWLELMRIYVTFRLASCKLAHCLSSRRYSLLIYSWSAIYQTLNLCQLKQFFYFQRFSSLSQQDTAPNKVISCQLVIANPSTMIIQEYVHRWHRNKRCFQWQFFRDTLAYPVIFCCKNKFQSFNQVQMFINIFARYWIWSRHSLNASNDFRRCVIVHLPL